MWCEEGAWMKVREDGLSGHARVQRMADDRLVKMIYYSTVHGKKKRGRRRDRGTDVEIELIRAKNISYVKGLTEDRMQ